MTEPRIFDRAERSLVRRTAREAEDLVGRFYCIPGREWPRFPVEVRTLADGPAAGPGVFAEIVRLVPDPADGSPEPPWREAYRILLRDDRILDAVRNRGDGVDLEPLLLYVLTHELVHVVRFGTGAASFDAPEPERSREERRVHEITARVLAPTPRTGLRRVIDLYRDRDLESASPSLK